MNSRIDTVNGKEVQEFKKNTDYFEMSDGVFWTVEALMKKYDIGKSTLYNKARDNNIPTMKVLGIVTFKDSDKFNKLKNGAGNIENLKGKGVLSYAELYRKIDELITFVRAATIPDATQNKEVQELILSINTRTFTHTAEISNLTNKLNLVYESCFRTEKMVFEILEHLTKGKSNDK